MNRILSTHTRRWALQALVASALGMVAACSPASEVGDSVSLDEARADVAAGRAILIDVREPSEHAQGVAPGARLLPTSQLPQRLAEIPAQPTKPVYLICRSQNRSRALLQRLRETGGYGHVRFVAGGMSGWADKDWALKRP